MKALYTPVLLILLFLTACKNAPKSEATASGDAESDILKVVAMAQGIDHWNRVTELRFTFNVDRDTMHFERSWIWKPKQQDVTLMVKGDTITYNRKAVDSTLAQYDASFINDKYWFLAPFQLVWDRQSFTYDLTPDTASPIAGKAMKKLTIVYGNEGGYTPGDAYDLYLDENNVIREWTFRRGNKPAPGADATWEDYEDEGGLRMATMHRMGGGASLYFTGIGVKTEDTD